MTEEFEMSQRPAERDRIGACAAAHAGRRGALAARPGVRPLASREA
jgi:hypothetical protein